MSSFAGYCGDCGKPVMHKTLFGTLHICLSEEERATKNSQLEMNKKMLAQRNVTNYADLQRVLKNAPNEWGKQ